MNLPPFWPIPLPTTKKGSLEWDYLKKWRMRRATMDGFFIRHSCLHAATDVTIEWRGHRASTFVREWEWGEIKNIKFIVNWNENFCRKVHTATNIHINTGEFYNISSVIHLYYYLFIYENFLQLRIMHKFNPLLFLDISPKGFSIIIIMIVDCTPRIGIGCFVVCMCVHFHMEFFCVENWRFFFSVFWLFFTAVNLFSLNLCV